MAKRRKKAKALGRTKGGGCKYGKLKNPVYKNGRKRTCKLAPKRRR
jgi:hypothetical protein